MLDGASEGTPPHLKVVPRGHVQSQHNDKDVTGSLADHPPLSRGAAGVGGMARLCEVVARHTLVSQVAIVEILVQEVDAFWLTQYGNFLVLSTRVGEGLVTCKMTCVLKLMECMRTLFLSV